MERVTLTKLIADADRIKGKSKETCDLFVKSLNGYITVKKPERSLCLDAHDMGAEGDAYLIMEAVVDPPLKDPQLKDVLSCNTPIEVVEAIFEPGEIFHIAREIIAFAGYADDAVSIVNDLKNS